MRGAARRYHAIVVRSQRSNTLVAAAVAWCAAAGAGLPRAAGDEGVLRLRGRVVLATPTRAPPVRLALEDLARDFGWVLGRRARIADGETGQVVVRIDPALEGPEQYRIRITADGAMIAGSDPLGAISGVYAFSARFLAVDPYWFWKDVRPPRRKELRIPALTIRSQPRTFRYRGWFVNDEDLLTEWKDGGGRRFIDYPFYRQVVPVDVADRIFETLLRAGGNLIIPASFVDVMNPPEARLVERAARRGLYVTQHHVEPVGVSHYGFENYWKKRGRTLRFSYGREPDRVREAWKAYVAKWHALCGDRVVWQLGLRGKADRAIWASDRSVSKADAGRAISRAIAEQWEIVRSVDPRERPPATATLWLEGSELMSRGALRFPKGVTIVFADAGASQTMQRDFHATKRRAEHTYGVYHHIAFWSRGPHLIQGTRPGRVKRLFDQVVGKGDRHYAILNVSNIREHLLGIAAATEIMNSHDGWDERDFLQRWAPECLRDSYRGLLDSLVELPGERLLQDGTCFVAARQLLAALAAGKRDAPQGLWPEGVTSPRGFVKVLDTAVAKLDRVIREYPADQVPPARREFHDVNLLTQARMLRATYRYLRELLAALDEPRRLAAAEAALEELLAARRRAEQGQWKHWYRGDKKVNVPQLLARTRALRARIGGERARRGGTRPASRPAKRARARPASRPAKRARARPASRPAERILECGMLVCVRGSTLHVAEQTRRRARRSAPSRRAVQRAV